MPSHKTGMYLCGDPCHYKQFSQKYMWDSRSHGHSDLSIKMVRGVGRKKVTCVLVHGAVCTRVDSALCPGTISLCLLSNGLFLISFICPTRSKDSHTSLCLVEYQTHNFILLRRSSQCSLLAFYSHCCIWTFAVFLISLCLSSSNGTYALCVHVTAHFFSWKAFVFPVTVILIDQCWPWRWILKHDNSTMLFLCT